MSTVLATFITLAKLLNFKQACGLSKLSKALYFSTIIAQKVHFILLVIQVIFTHVRPLRFPPQNHDQ